jgi:hypothetical protein
MNAKMLDRDPFLSAKQFKSLECGKLLAMFTGAAYARGYWLSVNFYG